MSRRGGRVRPGDPVDVGDREVALWNEIYRVEVGSGMHGMAVEGTDDLDLMGVYIEPPEMVIGLEESAHHYVTRTAGEGERSGAGDIDLTIYALRKFVRLACAGNPTVLTALYVPEVGVHVMSGLGRDLVAARSAFVSLQAGWRYLGYLDNQRRRMVGEGPRLSRVPSRPELVDRYGYDTKYASHAIRLGIQGVQMVRKGTLTLPLPDEDLAWVMQVKRGEVNQAEALSRIDAVRGELVDELDRAVRGQGVGLPSEPDMAYVNRWLVAAHEQHWVEKDGGGVGVGVGEAG